MVESPRRRSRWAAPLGLALLCGHCAVGALAAAALAGGLLTLPTVFGVDLAWVLPPVFILGSFAVWLWSGRRRDACEVRTDPHTDDSAG